MYSYNLLGIQRFKIAADAAVPAGEHQVRVEFTYDGGGPGKGGEGALFANGEQVAKGRVEQTQPLVFSFDETTDIGSDGATPVSNDYTSTGSSFTGRVRWVQIDLDEASRDEDHVISPEDRMRVAMAKQ